ncbi:unnamed protein product, partial [Musa acuminata subsp. burmannicoides]
DVRWRSLSRRKLLCGYNGFSPYGGFWNEVMTGRRGTNGDCCLAGKQEEKRRRRTIIRGRAVERKRSCTCEQSETRGRRQSAADPVTAMGQRASGMWRREERKGSGGFGVQ